MAENITLPQPTGTFIMDGNDNRWVLKTLSMGLQKFNCKFLVYFIRIVYFVECLIMQSLKFLPFILIFYTLSSTITKNYFVLIYFHPIVILIWKIVNSFHLKKTKCNLKKESKIVKLKLHVLYHNMQYQNKSDIKHWNLYLLTQFFQMFWNGCIAWCWEI